MNNLMNTDKRRRRALLGATAALAGLGGAGLAWWRLSPHEAPSPVPDNFWSLELLSPQGEGLRLSQWRGVPLVLNFWATWCPPCIEEFPLLDAFYRQNEAKGWQVLGLAVDKPSLVLDFLRQHPVSFPIAMAGSGGVSLSNTLGNSGSGLPFTVVLDAQGVIRQRKVGKISPQDLASWQAIA